jgi:hypothetical protein
VALGGRNRRRDGYLLLGEADIATVRCGAGFGGGCAGCPLEGWTMPIASTVTHAGICRTKKFSFDMP